MIMEKLLAADLQLPGGQSVTIPGVGGASSVQNPTFTGFLTPLINIVFYIAVFLMFSWMVWGIFEYLFAGGDKEKLGKARSRITWAIVGFIIVLIAFTIQQYIKEIFPPKDVNTVKQVTSP